MTYPRPHGISRPGINFNDNISNKGQNVSMVFAQNIMRNNYISYMKIHFINR